jgi:5-methylthioadenosine/S-adenosylhomocysteine deaminase
MSRLMLRGGYVVAHQAPSHQLLAGGCVVLDGTQITFVGSPADPACPTVDRVIDLPGRLISPGLINLHCIANLDLQILRIDVDHVAYPKTRAWFEGEREVLSEAQLRTSAHYSVAHLLRGGSTTFANVTTMASKRFDDPVVEPQALAEAATALGARAYLAHNFQDHARYDDTAGVRVVHDRERGRQGLRRALELIDWIDAHGEERVRGFLFPYTSQTCSDELLVAARDAAAERNLLLRSHFAQYPGEAREGIEARDESPVERLARLGLLGERTTLTHAIYLRGHPEVGGGSDERDLELLASSGTHVAHCPVVFARRGVVLRSFDRYRRAGINLGLGTDTMPADMPGEMRAASLLAKVADADPTAGRAADIFHAATVGGADALGRPDLGRLQAGATADIAIFDLRALHLGVIDCPIKALVHFAAGGDAEHVFVAGEQVVRDREVVALPADLPTQAQATWDDYRAALVARDPHGRSSAELYPFAYPLRHT